MLTGARILHADRRIQRLVTDRRSPERTRLMLAVSRLGSTPAVLVGVAAVSAVLAGTAPSAKPASRTALPTVLAGLGLRNACLRTIRRARPPAPGRLGPATGYSFPSGHSTNAAMAATVVTVALRDARTELPGLWVAAAAVGCCYTVAVGTSRVYLGVHWPSDVLAGWLLGLGWCQAARQVAGRAGRTT